MQYSPDQLTVDALASQPQQIGSRQELGRQRLGHRRCHIRLLHARLDLLYCPSGCSGWPPYGPPAPQGDGRSKRRPYYNLART